jgi:hypothetical protein
VQRATNLRIVYGASGDAGLGGAGSGLAEIGIRHQAQGFPMQLESLDGAKRAHEFTLSSELGDHSPRPEYAQ